MGVVMRSAVLGSDNASVSACGIAVMAKASVPRRTKTRLVPPLTFDQAAQCNTAFLRDAAENILAASTKTSIAGYLAYGPPDARRFFEENVPREVTLIEASYPSLGDCLDHAITQLLARGHRAAVVVNSDSPTLPTSLLVETAELLGRPGERAVLGPALDGGYYLLGVKARHPRLLEDIAWSTQRVAQQTLERAAELHLPVHMLPTWYDVDDVATLKMQLCELFDRRPFPPGLSPARAHYTRAFMQSLLEIPDLKERLVLHTFRRAAE